MRIWVCVGLFAGFATTGMATEMIHRFISPDMGGNPLNGTFLMNQANDQNTFKEPKPATGSSAAQKSPIEQFKSSLQSAILGQVSRSSVQGMFDTYGNIRPDTNLNFDLNGDGQGDFSVIIGSVNNGNVNINISDGITETILTVPYSPVTP